MKTLILALTMMLAGTPAFAQGDHAMGLKQVQNDHVCMITNRVYQTPQIAIKVDGKTYYGCCPMCKTKLENEAASRMAKDPVSGKEVDKAAAVIGAMPDGTVHYFENAANLKAFDGHGNMSEHKGMTMDMNHAM